MGAIKRTARWIAVSTVGFGLVVVGLVMLFLPGPGLLAIVAGLAVLSLEFLWAERLRARAAERLRAAREAAGRRRRRRGTVALRRPSDGSTPATPDGARDRSGSDAA